MRLKLLAWVIVFLLLSGTALALGLRPAQTKADFVPEGEREFVLKIINDEGKELNLKANVEGALARFVEIEEKEFRIKADEEITEVKVKLKFPKELPSGENIADVVLEQDVTDLIEVEAGASISAKLQLVHRITVNAQTPEKFIKADVQYEDKGQQVEITTDVTNFGFKEIGKIQSFLKISEGEEEIKKLETDAVSLLPNESAKLRAVLDKAEVTEGEYTVAATIQYDEKRLIISRQLLVGEPRVELVNYEKYLVAGKINSFKFEVKNLWNRAMQNVYAVISVFDNGREIYSTRTLSFDVAPKETKKVESYLDAAIVPVGSYDMLMQISFMNKTSEHKFKSKFFEREEDKEKAGSGFVIYFVIFALAVLILLAVIIILLARRGRGGLQAGGLQYSSGYSNVQPKAGLKTDEGWE